MSTSSFTVTVNRQGLNSLLRSRTGDVGRALDRLGNQMVNGAKARANVDSGLMRSRIEYIVEPGPSGALRLVLAARTNYSFFVHNGTRWYRGNPFLVDAAREALSRL